MLRFYIRNSSLLSDSYHSAHGRVSENKLAAWDAGPVHPSENIGSTAMASTRLAMVSPETDILPRENRRYHMTVNRLAVSST